MTHDDTLKPVGTQTADSVQVELAQRAKEAKERDEAAPAEVGTSNAAKVMGVANRVGNRHKVASDMATQLVKDDPIKAMLVAAAAGALLMGVLLALAMD